LTTLTAYFASCRGPHQPPLQPPGTLQDHPLDRELAQQDDQGRDPFVGVRQPHLLPRRMEVDVQEISLMSMPTYWPVTVPIVVAPPL
jgi:hypothetical protein